MWVALGSTAATLVVVDVADPLAPASSVASGPRSARTTSRSRHPAGASGSPPAACRDSRCTAPPGGGRSRSSAPTRRPSTSRSDPAGAYVASGAGRTLSVHAPADGAVRHRARTPLGSYNVARGDGVVLTPSLGSGRLTALDAGGRVRWSLRIAGAAHDVCVL